eukprot:CAMPEP_0118898560 /NCGR_PEP_ID=MMETSP1166-20130328/5499_1 /TAXON_ID=1104430 /ORGANISM="Chrysoreinhardia sp, Strain CCMP3193" /LENGTH=86 /DNA_ID=CAMNT_0006837669 /DNA_START=147 /DNA_END=404 /DNA_ORIENTATION=+
MRNEVVHERFLLAAQTSMDVQMAKEWIRDSMREGLEEVGAEVVVGGSFVVVPLSRKGTNGDGGEALEVEGGGEDAVALVEDEDGDP